MKKIWEIFSKKKKRSEPYVRIEDGKGFIFYSDIELEENDIKTAINIVLMNSKTKISKKDTIKEISTRLMDSNPKISSVDISTRDRGRTWFVNIN